MHIWLIQIDTYIYIYIPETSAPRQSGLGSEKRTYETSTPGAEGTSAGIVYLKT